MLDTKQTVLITGCSDGGLGSELAQAFDNAGFHVYATARNLSKMAHLSSLGIQTLELDVLSPDSITACVSQIPSLDMLVNNAGGGYSMPVADLDIEEAKKIFDLNVWSYIAVTQACLPLLLKSKGMIVNQTSVVGSVPIPFSAAYNASKAAMAMFTAIQRLELAPFGITVLELKTGVVRSNFLKNQHAQNQPVLPDGSIYAAARERVEEHMRGERFASIAMPADQWAAQVVHDVLRPNTVPVIWRGANAGFARVTSLLPSRWTEGRFKAMAGIDELERKVKMMERGGEAA
jgi:1-acylglycerone phosphate reductase